MADSPVNILLVDDRPDGLLTLEAVLDSADYKLYKAGTGPEALQQLAEAEFAVILLDVQMPGMDGFQTASKIKDNPAWKDIPILFVTAIHKDTPTIYHGYDIGAVDYIFKPFDPYVLRSKVAVFVELFRKTKRIESALNELRSKDEELYQIRKLEAIGRLAGGVAHDFNNITAGILGISEEIQASFPEDDPRREDLSQIIKASHRAFSLTRQLLAYARRQIISPEALDLNTVVTDMRTMLSRLIGEDIKLETVLEPAGGFVHADRGHLEQVVINLVLNARDAMPRGGVIAIQTAPMSLTRPQAEMNGLQLVPGSYTMLRVSDSGTGMSREVQDHLFEPFYTTKEKDKGTGLGLATVYGIIKQSGGDIAVWSQPNVGTRVDIYLPRLPRESRTTAPAEKTVLISNKGSETILVAEDEYLVRRVVTSLLRRNGYTVLTAQSGPEALTLCERHPEPIHLLITDVVMPEMNGRQLAQRVLEKHPNIAVLFMSGYTEDIIQHQGVLDPGITFIEKSRIHSDLTQKVRQVLSTAAAPPPGL